ncbi:Pseudouridylate synthase, putative [Giardia lamblia P15]|uniref:tRNA pseudouridine(55) synthase n=1 Tax=Giardia intestinalis (strain P15) TaxID=658858 RepID=E1EWJ6_GIAIA|nr:Pseudouridylate synthase, putative [Giardia lamblia P15]
MTETQEASSEADLSSILIASYRENVDAATQEITSDLIAYMIKRGFCPWCILRVSLWDDISLCGFSCEALRKGLSEVFSVRFPEGIDPSECPSCLGILLYCSQESFKNDLVHRIRNSGFESPNYILNIRAPSCLIVRDALLVHELYGCANCESQVLPTNADEDTLKELLPIPVKRILKYMLGPYCMPRLGMPVATNAHLRCVIHVETSLSPPEIPASAYEQMSASRRKEHNALRRRGKDADEMLQGLLSDIIDKELHNHALIEKLANTKIPLRYQHVKITVTTALECDSIYIAGRYLKHQRYISQTGYENKAIQEKSPIAPTQKEDKESDDGEAHGFHPKISISSLLVPFFIAYGSSDDAIFHAAGREDIDVRMKGDGRPFIVELINSKNGLSRDWASLARDINADPHVSQFIHIHGDTLVAFEKNGRELIDKLASGSNEKRKSYRAVCWTEKPLPSNTEELCRAVQNLSIEQATPIRVLHRRTAMKRTKLIHGLKFVRKLSDHYFVIDIFAQAGTYIKEFCNSDFGRTRPSLSELLFGEYIHGEKQPEVEILQLDVLTVDMEWPPIKDSGVRSVKQ